MKKLIFESYHLQPRRKSQQIQLRALCYFDMNKMTWKLQFLT